MVADISNPDTHFTLNQSSNLDIRVHGETAMVIADLHQVFVRDGKPFDYWIKKNGKWWCWSGHATLLKKE